MSTNVDIFFDTTAQTVEVYRERKSDRIVKIEQVKSESQARAALKRRGFTVKADSEDPYPYGVRWTGTSTSPLAR